MPPTIVDSEVLLASRLVVSEDILDFRGVSDMLVAIRKTWEGIFLGFGAYRI
jgi:hypothetical protein